jgi:hypothetical protein
MTQERKTADIVWSGLISLVAIIVLHQPSLSIQKLLIGSNVLTFPEMAGLKFLSGLLTSALVIALCGLVLRRFSMFLILAAVVVQILWIEFEWGFSVRASDAGEFVVRFAEELGVLVSGAVLILYLQAKGKSRVGKVSN